MKTGAWVKYYSYHQLHERHDVDVDLARRIYQRAINDEGTSYAQFGAKSNEGNIVLGEYRKPQG